MTRWRVSINGGDPDEVEAVTAAGAAALAEVDFNRGGNERREVETLVVHRAERKPLPAVKAMVLDGKSGWVGEVDDEVPLVDGEKHPLIDWRAALESDPRNETGGPRY